MVRSHEVLNLLDVSRVRAASAALSKAEESKRYASMAFLSAFVRFCCSAVAEVDCAAAPA